VGQVVLVQRNGDRSNRARARRGFNQPAARCLGFLLPTGCGNCDSKIVKCPAECIDFSALRNGEKNLPDFAVERPSLPSHVYDVKTRSIEQRGGVVPDRANTLTAAGRENFVDETQHADFNRLWDEFYLRPPSSWRRDTVQP
jgi:hypothetical protein